MSGGQLEPAPKRPRTRTIVGTAVSGAVVVALVAALTVLPTERLRTDAPAVSSAEVTQKVSPRQIDMVCPSRMALADTASYGDKEFQASEGDLASSARFAAFGSVFHSQVSALEDTNAIDATVLSGPQDEDGGQSALVAASDDAKEPLLFDTRVLKAQQGTGATGTVASWATKGDMPGIAASGCVPTALSQSFLVPSTQTGNTQQLVLSNPTDKSTSVELTVRDADGKDVALATNSTIAVAANGQASVMLQAGAPDRKALYVTVTSEGTPVGAVVKSVSIDGLTPKGNDYIMPAGAAATEQAMPLASDGSVTLMGTAAQDTKAEVSWMTDHGLVKAQDITLKAGQVTQVDLKDRPDEAAALFVQSESPCTLAMRTRVDGKDGHSDFAWAQGSAPYAQSALAIAPGTTARLSLANLSSAKVDVTLRGYDAKGNMTGTKEVGLDASSAVALDASSLGKDTVAIDTDHDGKDLVWGAYLGVKAVTDAGAAAVAYSPASSLAVPQVTVAARQDASIVR
ncbi:MAG: DUF5719 family protein [Bifidobacterium sp.]|nr:DUF5719 family protein [Bifidobacterium sp.]